MATYETYNSSLTAESTKKAKDELNERPEENRAQLKQFTDWIKQQQKWLTAPTDPILLMSFLRVRKFSQLLARETLVNFYLTRQTETQFYQNMDSQDPKSTTVLKSGFFLPLPKRDKHGRQVFLIRPGDSWEHKGRAEPGHKQENVLNNGKLDVSGKVYTIYDALKTVFLVIEFYMKYEECQVNGIVMFVDYSNVTMKHQTFAGDARSKFIKLLTKTYPLRVKNILVYNAGAFMEIILGIIKPILNDKMKERFSTSSDMMGVYKIIGEAALPAEYLPDDYDGDCAGTCPEIIEKLLAELKKPEARDWEKLVCSGTVDKNKMPPKDELFQEAFRKLDVN